MDLAFLKLKNIVDGRVQYKRRKAGRFYDIKITPNLKSILQGYLEDKEPENFILPIVKRESIIGQYKDVQWAHKRHNQRLKEIANLAGIEENLTSYVSRHSFASIANKLGVPVTAISEMLGHEKLSTTQVYLSSLKQDVLDQYNEQVIGGGE
jgi:site-specific recombinase XerD